MEKDSAKTSFVKGAVVLMIFGLLSKVLGAIYRIPLTSILTPEGMGLYQMVFPVYSLMLTISSSGLPSSISKLISENLAKRQYKQADRILKVSFFLLILFSFICGSILFFGSKLFAKVQGNEAATICYLGLVPAIIFVGLISGFRGYFQGRERMLPSAISQFVEQLMKLIFGLGLAAVLIKRGVRYAVLGATLGISLSEVFAFIYLLISFLVYRKNHGLNYADDIGTLYTPRQTAKNILGTSVFITLGSLIMPLGMIVDSSLIINILKSIGYSVKEATSLFGLATGTVGSIVNMPVVLSLALATAILPCVSSKSAKEDMEGANKAASKAMLLALLIALPAAVGCFALAKPIIMILYGRSLDKSMIDTAASIMQVASVSIFYLALLQVSSGILQGISLVYVPAISLTAGLVVKIVLNIVLVRITSINILGSEVANSMCYLTALIINLIVIKRHGILKLSIKVFALIGLALLVLLAMPIFDFLVGINLNFYLAFMLTVFGAIVVYFFFAFLLFKKELKVKV